MDEWIEETDGRPGYARILTEELREESDAD